MTKCFTAAVTAAFGLESCLKKELEGFGILAPAINGRCEFLCDFATLCRLNLCLRCADRVYIVIGKIPAESFDELFEGLSSLPFENYISKNGRITISAKCVKSKIFAVTATQSVSKKAVVTRLTNEFGLNTLPENGENCKIEVSLFEDVATVLLDTSGDGLFKRGYRDLFYEAPMKETLAAGIIELSFWSLNKELIDPFCGSGTIPIEAAMKILNIPPCLNRKFAFSDFPFFDGKVFKTEVSNGIDGIKRDLKPSIAGYDISEDAISKSLHHAKRAGVDKYIHFQKRDMRNLSSKKKYGVIITNPPYAERLLSPNDVRLLYTDFFKVFKALPDWSLYLITAYQEFERIVKCKADKERKLFNGNLECRLYQYFGNKPPKDD